jgi:hypothetical protein
MIYNQQRYNVVPLLQAAQEVKGGPSRVCPHNAITVFVMPLQVAFDGAENFRIVIDR